MSTCIELLLTDPNPDPDIPWILLDMETGQLAVLDLEEEVVYVPEPDGLILLGSGVAGLAMSGRKKRV
jgi:hypothetical protein